jgi:hypothetical protein
VSEGSVVLVYGTMSILHRRFGKCYTSSRRDSSWKGNHLGEE